MSILSQTVDTEEDCLFEAYLDSVKNVSVLLKAVNFKDVCMAVSKKMWIYTSTPIRLHGVVLN
jgi:hypothetical protein